ncbi:zinc finger protein ZAT8-like [Miscanthus floridulus]|uniref:zinc finger protein ZAT8-like n=1 Tax=Miscanthus floridulus TaxID=154761 RepID=UPI00345995F3
MVMTLTRYEAEESKEMEGLRTHAEALLTLSSPVSSSIGGGTPSSAAARRAMAAEGVFECKTCSKRFPSFQALGGHRTSHTRLQARMLSDPAAAAAAAERDRARVHECAVCGLEFSMGQALGGHMRRHRGEAPPPAAHDNPAAQTDRDMPDLNLPPLDDDGICIGSGDGQGPQQSDDDRGSEPQLLNLLV